MASNANLLFELARFLKKFTEDESKLELSLPGSYTPAEQDFIQSFCRLQGIGAKCAGQGLRKLITLVKTEGSYLLTPADLTLTSNSRKEIFSLLSQCPINHLERQELLPLPSTFIRQKGAIMGQDGRQTSGRINSGIPQRVPPALTNRFDDYRKTLPIWGMRNQIVQSIWNNQVIIISGASGSGKSTQVPQFIMETCELRNEPCRIICTQPRRLSAMTVSERIAVERGEPIGQTIGYQVRLESKLSPRTVCTLCTYRVLLRTIMGSEESQIAHVTHVIMDEVHERNRISDFLAIELRTLLVKNPNLRLILMASTPDMVEFQKYFGGCPLIDIPARVQPVEVFFLEDVLELTGYSTERMKKLERSQGRGARETEQKITDDSAPRKCLPQIDPQVVRDMDQIINNILEEDLDNEDNFDQLFCLVLSDNVSVDYAHSHSGVTPLMAVCKAGHLPSVQRLLRLGASVMLKTKVTEKTAFDFARGAEKADVVEMLQSFMENERVTPIDGNTILRGEDGEKPGGGVGAKETEQRLGVYYACFDDEQVDIDLLVELVKYVLEHDKTSGSVLVFLPGYDEIIRTSDALNAQSFVANSSRVKVLFLHSKLQATPARGETPMLHQVFEHSIPGPRKIVLATDIAETSVTIDDVTIVIDSGKCREKACDVSSPAYKSSNWIAKINAKYREARAGRVVPGSCYRLYSMSRFNTFAESVLPEIQREPLEELCLHAKVIAGSEVSITNYLSRAPSPPAFSAIQSAIVSLKNIDALDKKEELTELGSHLADLPLPPHLGKMVLYSIILRCVDPVLTIASALAYRDPFVLPLHPSQKRLAARARVDLADRTFSDHVALLRVFQEWNRNTERDRSFRRGTEMEVKFCERNFVSSSTMRVIFDIRTKLLQELRALKFIHSRGGGDMRDLNANSERWPMVKGALCAGLYPNLLRVDRARGEAVCPKEGKIRFHSSSVLYQPPTSDGDTIDAAHQQTIAALPTDWLIFERVCKSHRHATIRCCTAVSAITVGLFAGTTRHLTMSDEPGGGGVNGGGALSSPGAIDGVKEAEIDGAQEVKRLKIDDWISFVMDYSSLYLLQCLRVKFHALVMRRMRQPGKGWTALDQYVLTSVERLLCNEENSTGLQQPSGIGQRPRQMHVDFGASRAQHKFPQTAAALAPQQAERFAVAAGIAPEFNLAMLEQQISMLPVFNPSIASTNSGRHSFQRTLPQLENSYLVSNHFDPSMPPPTFTSAKIPDRQGAYKALAAAAAAAANAERPSAQDPFHVEAFFVVKPRSSEVYDYAVSKNVWATGIITERKLCRAFSSGKNVFLVFSFPVTSRFLGVARMRAIPSASRSDPDLSAFFGANCGGAFPIEWVARKDVSFNETNNLANPWNEGKQVKISREGQEIEPVVGRRLLGLFVGKAR